MKPEFAPIDSGLWQWRDWFIAMANGNFWLLTPTPREFGPFSELGDAMAMVHQLVL